MVELNQTIQRSDDFVFNTIDGELVMMNINSGNYSSLNETGAFIWDLLKEPKKINEILKLLEDSFNVTPNICLEEVVPFIEILLNKRIIQIVQ